jgi:predicted transcriptional regulator
LSNYQLAEYLMNAAQREDLLYLLKAVADEQRLTMIGLLSTSERTVSEMAGLLELSEPTVSHHVSKLHSVGLLRLRMAGNQHFYHINESRLAEFKIHVGQIEILPEKGQKPASDNTWIDVLGWDSEDKRVLYDYTLNGRITRFPAREKKWLVILRWLATKFQPGIRYTEKQVNTILAEVHHDYATLRRNLVEYGFMRRERGGGDYWLTPENEL